MNSSKLFYSELFESGCSTEFEGHTCLQLARRLVIMPTGVYSHTPLTCLPPGASPRDRQHVDKQAFAWHPFQFARRQPVSACSGSPPQCSTFSSFSFSLQIDIASLVLVLINKGYTVLLSLVPSWTWEQG